MKHTIKRMIALLLTICMLGSVLPLQIWAEEAQEAVQPVKQGEQPASLVTPEGEIPAEEDWDEEYPYGTFAFGTYQADLGEPGAVDKEGQPLNQTILLPVYRVGGSVGRATVKITYAPAVTTDETGTQPVYDYAASGKLDLLLETEDANPLALYQTVGLPKAEREMQPAPGVGIRSHTDDDGSMLISLTDAEEAAGYRWQYKGLAGGWQDVEGGTEATLKLTMDDCSALGITDFDGLDFRCILTVEDFLLCSISLMGESFAPYPEAGPAPEGLTAPEEPTFTAVEFAGDYDVYEFSLTFADGETVKYLRVTALDDDIPELPELGLFTIVGCEGGACSDLCNTLTLMVSDNEEGDPSEIGFTLSAVTVDRAEGVAWATVRRTGGTSYNVTVDYTTEDGTAKAGEDYAAKSGTLAFAGSIDEITVPIELISGEETDEKTFTLKLSNVKGGGTEALCSLENDTISFTLTGESPKGESGQNLASVLSGADGKDASDRLSVEEKALIPTDEPQRVDVRMPDSEHLTAELTQESKTRMMVVNTGYQFRRPAASVYDAPVNGSYYWHDWELVAGSNTAGGTAVEKEAVNAVDYTGLWSYMVYTYENKTLNPITFGASESKTGIDKNKAETFVRHYYSKTKDDPMFSSYLELQANFGGSADHTISKAGDLYDQAVLITYLDQVGIKKKSGSGSFYVNPGMGFMAIPHDDSVYSTGQVNYAIAYLPTTSTVGFPHWMSSQGNNSSTWTMTYPHTLVSGDYTDTSWPDDGKLSSFAVPLGTDLCLWFSYEPYNSSGNLLGNIEDANEVAQNGGYTAIDIVTYRLHRRVLQNTASIPVVAYTANDPDESGKNTWAAIPANSSIYTSISPKLSLVPGQGGVDASGRIYVGSTFEVDASAMPAGYSIAENGLFFTKTVGNTTTRVGTATYLGGSKWQIALPREGITQDDLTATYKLNLFLERSQTIEIDLGPSVARTDGVANAGAVETAKTEFLKNTADINWSKLNVDGNGLPSPQNGVYFSQTMTSYLPSTGLSLSLKPGTEATFTTTQSFKNVQLVNFHQDERDVILYNGKAYKGNEDIRLSESDLGAASIHFIYYHRDYLTAVSPMYVEIDHVELYYDGDADGKISGDVDGNNLFQVDPESKDELITRNLSGDYPESTFKPVVVREYDEDGKVTKTTVYPYYLKVFYTMRPRALKMPAGATSGDRAQILPAITTAITDDTAYKSLTAEQRSYRYVHGNHADEKLMYGQDASLMDYLDIPLGGDVGTVFYSSTTQAVRDKNGKITGATTKETYTWDPDYRGYLLVPFGNPTPVADTDNITGHSVEIAGEKVTMNAATGAFNYSADGLRKMNGFLGAMVGRSTFALGVQQQSVPLNSIESLKQIQPENITVGTVATVPNGDSVMNQTAGGEPGNNDSAGPGEDSGYPEFNADLGTEMPSLELELGDYATLIMDGYQIGFAIGIPIYKYEDTSYSGSETTKKGTDGSTIESHVDENGVYHETKTSEDKKTITETTSTPDEKDPNKRTVVQVKETTDDKGNKSYETVTEQQEKKTDPKTKKETWETTDKTTTNTKPPAPSQEPEKSKGEKFKEGFKEANGGMQTLAEFAKACKTGKLDELKDFFSGAFEDDSLKNAKNGNCTSTKVEVAFTVQISIMFEYNPIDNCHYFKSAGLAASLGIEVSAQHRFSAFPLAYVYVKLGIEVEVAVSLSCIRNPKLGTAIKTFRQGSLAELSSGKPLVFDLNMKKTNGVKIRGFHIDLLGSVYMEIYDNPSLTGEPLAAGALSGDGTEKEVLLEDYDQVVYIRLTPLRGTVVAENLRPVTGASSKVVFDGVNITPSIELEAGVGIGIELLKFELFVKTSVAITLTMGGYLEETDRYEGFYVSSFEWGLCVGFNVTALFFNYSMDAIGISVEGAQHGTGGYFDWHIAATALNGDKELWSKDTYTAADGKALGTEEPEPPEDNNIGPLDTEFCYTFGGFPNNANYYSALPITLTDQGFPDDCGWELKENVAAWEWDGGEFKGEIPQDGDLCKATRDRCYVEFPVPEGAEEIFVFFDGKIDIQCGGYNEIGVKKSPAKIPVSASAEGVRLTVTKGTLLDRWGVTEDEEDCSGKAAEPARNRTDLNDAGLIHVTGPKDVSATQQVKSAGQSDTRAITPTGTADFELSGYNTAGDAKKLVSGLRNGYSYKLFQADGENYILYPLMLDGAAQLVMSRIVMTGNLAEITGLEHPTDPDAAAPWLKVDSDKLGDLDYQVSVNGKTVTVVWTAYQSEPADSAVESAKRVVVKRASLTLGTDETFSQPEVLTPEPGSYRFLPAQSGDAAVWGEALGDGSAKNEMLAAFLIATNDGLDMETLLSRTTSNALLANAVYRWTMQSDLNAISGDSSVLAASTGARAEIPGETIENIELGVLDGRTFVLYSTSQTACFDASQDVPVTVAPQDFDPNTELATIRRLYLRELTGEEWGNALLLQTVIDFDGCTDDNIESRTLKDGVYIGGGLQTKQADPYYGNLRFIRADLEGSGAAETLLLFEMGGNSYLLRQADALSLLSGGEGSVLPIFEQATGTDVSISSDGENLAVVYTAAVPNSMSNAIWSAWWDRSLGGWGSPTILAMRHLQVYEDGIKYDMEPKALEQAFLGKQNTPAGNTGSMSRLYFSDLQMSTRTVKKDDGSEDTQLMVLTMGSLQELEEHSFPTAGGKDLETLTPKGDAALNFYAIAFGVGDQALGEARLSLANYDFSAGNKLVGELSFVNTGTTAIRGSRNNPILVKLLVDIPDKESQPLAQWQLAESIRSGASVTLSFQSLELGQTLPAGSTLRVTVEEDSAYFQEPFAAELPGLLTVEEKPELSVSGLSAKLIGSRNNKALLQIELEVINSGNTAAQQVYVQFAYDTGLKDEVSGLPIYKPVDITDSSLVTVLPEKRARVTEDYQHGVYQLKDINGAIMEVPTSNYRVVQGTLAVPVSCFVSMEELSGLHLRAEAYSDLDSPDYNNGLYSSDHNEYNSYNNSDEIILKHTTIFNVPGNISTALGTTLTLPVSFESTSPNPDLELEEVSDGTEGWEPRMGVCYYDAERGVIVAAPNAKAQAMLEAHQIPTGILRLRDRSTNTIAAIAYRVGSMAEGVNIYRDDESFTFHDADNSLTELDAAVSDNPGWLFRDWPSSTGWICGSVGQIPMNHDLSIANQDNAWVSFQTVADTMTIYYMGEITVSSDLPGFTTKTFRNTDLAEGQTTALPAEIRFENADGRPHTVRITAKAGTMLDRYTATYPSGTIPETDPNAPQILWNRSYPETASILPGEGVPMTCYIVDGTGIKSVSFAGQTLSEMTTPALVKLDDGLWYFDYTFTSNGAYTVQAADLSNNSAKGTVGVDWFNDVLSAGAIAAAPGLTRTHVGFVDADGNTVSTAGTLTTPPFLKSTYTPESNEQSAAYLFSEGAFGADPLGKTTDERWLANWNGYYQVRIDRADGTWARAITVLKNLDDTPPSVKPDLPGAGTPDSPYLIDSRANWQKMRDYVNGGNPTAGMCFRQTADFAINEQDMVGTSGNPFMGVYDGGGHTLTFNSANAPASCAPFQYANNAAFRNLHVDGDVTTTQKFAAGLLASAFGICSFYNCRVSITIHSNLNGDGTHGGFVSLPAAGSQLNFSGCVVDGSFLGSGTTLCGGFVGYTRGALMFQDCVFAPAAWEWTSSQNFYRWTSSAERILQNSYYLDDPAPKANDQGSLGYAVTPGTDVALTRTGGKDYDVAGLYGLSTGVFFGDALLAAEGETVAVLPYYTGSDPENAEDIFLASSGTFTENGGGSYSLVMPAEDVVISIDTHNWGEPTYTWAEDNSAVTARRVCSYNSAHVETETVETTSEVTLQPTCINSGKTTYTATFTNPAFEPQTRTLPDIPALGHEWGEPSYEWAADNSSVTATRVCNRDASHVETETVSTTSEVTKPAACEEVGETTYTATFTNPAFAPQTKTVADIPALGHAWGEPEYVWDGTQSVTATRVCALDASHVETETVQTTAEVTTPPTCTEAGKTTYTATFTNPIFAIQSKTETDVLPLGHDWAEPTYTWAEDNSTVTATRVCTRDETHVETETVNTTGEVTKAATCTEPGETTYTATFTNPAFETQTRTVADLEPIGHKYELISWAWEGYTAAKASFTCAHDETHTLTLEAEITSVRTEPSCTEPGKVVYTAAVTMDGRIYTDEQTEVLPATGHAYALTAWSWDGYTSAEAIFTCQNDAGHVETVPATITSVRTDPKPEEDGSVVYTATVVFEGKTYTDTKTEILPAIGHDYELTGWTWEGFTKATASFIDRNGGDPITVEATISVERTEPSCETTGQAVYTASVTLGEKTYSDSKTETLEALGHDWGEPNYEWADDYSSVTATAVCRRDTAHILTETVTPTYIITKPSTYKEEGIGTYTAEFESEVFTAQTVQVAIPSINCDGGESCPSAHFTDMPGAGHWTHLPIDWAVVNKVTVGTSETTFSPNDDCTRAQFVTFLWRTMGSPEPELTENPFEDVKANRYYYKAVLWAYENGITAGTSETTFSPDDSCTRAQIVTFLWRMEGSEEPTITETPFEDLKLTAYYMKAVLWAYENDITAGTSATTFSPNKSCTRAEAVTFLYREFAK